MFPPRATLLVVEVVPAGIWPGVINTSQGNLTPYTSVPAQSSANMNILLEKERELMKLNLEIDERNKSITSESPPKKSGPSRGRVSKGRGSRPQSRSRSIEVNFINKDEEKFCWSQLSNQNPNNYIWAPMSQEELDHNNYKDPRQFSIKPAKKLERKMANSIENVSSVSSGDNDSELQNGSQHEDDFSPAEQREEGEKTPTGNKAEQTHIRMLNIKLRGLETALDKINFEKHELSQEKDQLEKEIKIVDEQRRRLDITNRNMTAQVEKSKGELEDVRHKLSVVEEDNNLLKKELDEAKREAKKNLSKKSSSDIRLNRALEEAAKLRGQLQAAEREKKDALENGKKSVDELTIKIKFLEKQRNELLHGFKKQMELIDVLKRQKLHLEAAHVLKYTEEEFLQTLDWKPNGALCSAPPPPQQQHPQTSSTTGN